jgi:1-pyrroline-5-carboxylate dehydrogenase
MTDAFFQVPTPINEPVLSYGPGSPEKVALKAALKDAMSKTIELPMTIGGRKVTSTRKVEMRPPHEKAHLLGHYHRGDASHVQMAIDAAMSAKPAWEAMPWQERAAIFLKAADLLAGPYRARMNAATMLGQGKNAYQAEIDCVCELVDFWRFNCSYLTKIYGDQPISSSNTWNRMDYRPLEGFIFALTPFNFTAIAGNLPSSPALMGNVCVWKPSETQIYSAGLLMEILEEAGLPPGVINLVFVSGQDAGGVIFNHTDFSGLHFTGSTGVFNSLWNTIAGNLGIYKSYPRIVGETGGKDFVIAHPSADPKAIAVGLVRGSFEYQGQKCSAASRAYLPESLWKETWGYMKEMLDQIKVGSPLDFRNFVNAVIDEKSFDKIKGYIDRAKEGKGVFVLHGGEADKEIGYFIQPTVIQTIDPHYETMVEEIFGPVLTIYVYPDKEWEQTLKLVDTTSPYALTGAVFSKDRKAVDQASLKLRQSAGNFYINDKPTGAVVGQQPFGGARGSGTNDKAGSLLNLLRWVSPRSIKETFVSPTDYTYPFMSEE